MEYKRGTYVAAHSGADPVHHGGPSPERLWIICHLTRTDEAGRRFFRRAFNEGWRRLRTADDFATLNRVIDGSVTPD